MRRPRVRAGERQRPYRLVSGGVHFGFEYDRPTTRRRRACAAASRTRHLTGGHADVAYGLVDDDERRLRRPVVSGGCDPGGMIPWNLLDLDKALRASWAADTCSPDDQADWQSGNPAWGHCDITALIVNDVFGGDLIVGEVHRDETQHGFHWWNRLPSGVELDLTREQFQHGQTVTAARVVERPAGPLPRRWEEYLLLRERVIKHLGPLPEPV